MTCGNDSLEKFVLARGGVGRNEEPPAKGKVGPLAQAKTRPTGLLPRSDEFGSLLAD
jgi:hypothetical protein